MGCQRLTYHQKTLWKTENTPIFVMGQKQGGDYQVFGMQMPGRSFNSGEYRYGYGNHEKIDEVSGSGNTVDMGDRWLDVRLGRTPKMDAHANKYPFISPYAYALNNPIVVIDPDGKDIVILINETIASEGDPGHTMIGVDEYDDDGKKTGNIIIYDLYPERMPAGNEEVKGVVKPQVMTVEEVKEYAKTRGDEILTLQTSKEQDENVLSFLSATEKAVGEEKKKYKADNFNCTSLATIPLEKFVFEGEELGKVEINLGIFGTYTVDSPNHLWNDLKDKDEVIDKSTDREMDESQASEYVKGRL